MAVALILLLVAVASVAFHLWSPWWWTPIASNWRYIDDTITMTFWITGAVFFAVVAFMAYCVYRFHHKEGRQAAYEPENKKLEWWLTIGTAVGVGAMLAPGLVVWHPERRRTSSTNCADDRDRPLPPQPAGCLQRRQTGHQPSKCPPWPSSQSKEFARLSAAPLHQYVIRCLSCKSPS